LLAEIVEFNIANRFEAEREYIEDERRHSGIRIVRWMNAIAAPNRKGKVTMATRKAKIAKQTDSALTSAAEAVGTALGRLALKVGLATPAPKKKTKRKAAPKKPASGSAPARTKKATAKKKG
jgi:hypothetical protein